MAKKIDTKEKYGDGERWFRWNKALLAAIEKSIESGRRFIEESYIDVFNQNKPKDQTYRKCGLKIAYYLQEQDCRAKGTYSTASPDLLARFKAASEFGYVGHLSTQDPWGLDTARPDRQGNPQNLKPKEKSQRTNDLEEDIKSVGEGKKKIEFGKGTKGHTVFQQGPKKGTVKVVAKKNPFTYDLSKDWDKNALYWRLWRWSRKEK